MITAVTPAITAFAATDADAIAAATGCCGGGGGGLRAGCCGGCGDGRWREN